MAGKTKMVLCCLFLFSSFLCVYLMNVLWFDTISAWSCFKSGCAAVISLIAALTLADIIKRDISEFHSGRGIFDQYCAIVGMNIMGYFVMRGVEKGTKLCRETQEKILLNHLKTNSQSEYGQKYAFQTIKTREDFVKKHPLTRYSDYADYISRLAKGEENLLTSARPTILAVTSGTSGKSNLIPMVKRQGSVFFLHGIAVVYRCMLNYFPGTKNLLKTMKLFYTPRWRTSEAGIPVGPNSSSPTNSKKVLNLYSTPLPGYEIMTEKEALYVHLLFGLKDSKLGSVEANFASLVYTAFLFLEKHWKNLVTDIELGKLNSEIEIDEQTRNKINVLLSPDPQRAAELRNQFSKGFDGIVKRIWPKCSLLLCVDTGSFHLYGQALQKYYGKGIPIYSPLYAATEGLLGINIWPEKEITEYLLVPEAMFYEFIPIKNSDEDQPVTVFVDQVEIDKEYEMVITNFSGLYRYRFGDVIKVNRFYNNCPVVEFRYRQGQFLNVRGEKTSEKHFYDNLVETVDEWPGIELVDYCCAESILLQDKVSNPMPHYLVFLELDCAGKSVQLTSDQKEMIDNNLCESFVYNSFRKKGSIGCMVVYLVRRGTFLKLRQYLLDTTQVSPNQYKVPRVLKRKEALEFLMKEVLH